MKFLTPYVTQIEECLRKSKHQELALYELYETADNDTKKTIVLAMIGKLIEQNKWLSGYKHTG